MEVHTAKMYLNVFCYISQLTLPLSLHNTHSTTVTFISHLLVEIPVYWVLDVVVGIIAEIERDWAGSRLGNCEATFLQRLRRRGGSTVQI